MNLKVELNKDLLRGNVQGVQKITYRDKKQILTKIEWCVAKFAHEHDLGAIDPANSLNKKRPKNLFPVTGGAG